MSSTAPAAPGWAEMKPPPFGARRRLLRSACGSSRSFVALARMQPAIVAAAKPRAARPARAEAAPPTASGVPCAARYAGQARKLGPEYRASNNRAWRASAPTPLRCAARRWLPHALAGLAAPAFAGTAEFSAADTYTRGLRGRRCPVRAIWVATSSAGPGSARASAHQQLTRRGCLNAVSAANEVSSAARPRTEQRSAVGAQRRPPPYEPAPGNACRDALNLQVGGHSRTTVKGRQWTLAARAGAHLGGQRSTRTGRSCQTPQHGV
jgi:hypothetical protein